MEKLQNPLGGQLAPFTSITHLETLLSYDGLSFIYSLNLPDGPLAIAHWADKDDEVDREIIIPTTSKMIEKIKNNEVTLVEGYQSPYYYIVDFDVKTGEIVNTWKATDTELDKSFLPQEGVYLEYVAD